jgi:hypothetical protein
LGHFVAWHLEPQHLETRRLAVDIRSYGDIYQQNPATSSNNQQHIQHELGMNLVKNMGKMNMMNDMGKHGRKKCRTSAPHLTDSKHAAGPAGLR